MAVATADAATERLERRSEVGGNGATGGQDGGGAGGGVFNAAGANVSISGTTFTANLARGRGGWRRRPGRHGHRGHGGDDNGGVGVGGVATGGTGAAGGAGGGTGAAVGSERTARLEVTGKTSTFSANRPPAATVASVGCGGERPAVTAATAF